MLPKFNDQLQAGIVFILLTVGVALGLLSLGVPKSTINWLYCGLFAISEVLVGRAVMQSREPYTAVQIAHLMFCAPAVVWNTMIWPRLRG